MNPWRDPIFSLLQRWEALAHEQAGLTDYERGVLDGVRHASIELRTLLGRLGDLPTGQILTAQGDDESVDFHLVPEDSRQESLWEYLYVTFTESVNGGWQIKDVHGGVAPELAHATTFSQAIYQLREKGGWRLASFAKGIHVFRRPRTSSE